MRWKMFYRSYLGFLFSGFFFLSHMVSFYFFFKNNNLQILFHASIIMYFLNANIMS